MDTPAHDAHITTLPDGWTLIERFDGAGVVLLEFQRGSGRMGPRVSGIGATLPEAMRYGLNRMLRYDEQDRRRGKL
jgi:hypothetical protein